MKKIIDGALYNTETANCLADHSNGLGLNDFGYWCETLYRTKSGKYFLYCEGGPNSQYGVWHGNSGGWGEEIRPFSPDQARAWAENALDGNQYIAIFGAPDEASDNSTTFCWSTSQTILNGLRSKKLEGKSLSSLIDEAVKKYWKI